MMPNPATKTSSQPTPKPFARRFLRWCVGPVLFGTVLGCSAIAQDCNAEETEQAVHQTKGYNTNGNVIGVAQNASRPGSGPAIATAPAPSGAPLSRVTAGSSSAAPTVKPVVTAVPRTPAMAPERAQYCANRNTNRTADKLTVLQTSCIDKRTGKRCDSFDTFKTGDAVELTVSTARAGYLYVLNVDSKGNVNCLYPEKTAAGRCDASQHDKLAAGEQRVMERIEFMGSPGTERLMYILSPTLQVDKKAFARLVYLTKVEPFYQTQTSASVQRQGQLFVLNANGEVTQTKSLGGRAESASVQGVALVDSTDVTVVYTPLEHIAR